MIWNERIKQMRSENKLTLKEVAKRLGVQEATAQRYESGEIKNIPYHAIISYSEIFSCSPAYIMGWTEKRHMEGENVDELAILTNQLIKDKELTRALKIFFTLSPEKRRHIIDSIYFLGGLSDAAQEDSARIVSSSQETTRNSV